MNTARLQSETSWAARIIGAIFYLGTACALAVAFVFSWYLVGDGVDFPPTWYIGLTILLTMADLAGMVLLVLRIKRLLTGQAASVHPKWYATILLLLLATSHAVTPHVYSIIPMWEFQNSLFDDLSWHEIPGGISQECREGADQGTYQLFNVSASPSANVGVPTSYEEVKRIARIHEWPKHFAELKNRIVVGWRGWIHDVSRHGYYSNPDHRLVSLFLHDPYSSDVAAQSREWSEVVLYYFDSEDVGKLTVGQEVLVCGEINDADTDLDAGIHISIAIPVVNPLPLPEALASTQIPEDFALEYEAHGCGDGYECDEFDLQIDAQGNVTYNGYDNVPITGTHIAHIPGYRVRQLVFELQRTKFLAIENLPEKVEGSLKGATVIRVRMDGQSKTVVLPWEGERWPERISMLIGKIEEVTNLRQWVPLVKSP
ncbi:MAG: DUF6438 domain-containing protein [Chloroflexota bacterium]|nr:DUF6438 domain-containing protein [Chloroflexota bacterium]